MKHRLCNFLGNSKSCVLANNIILPKDIWSDFKEDFCKSYSLINKWGGYDYHYKDKKFLVGIEPTYKFDEFLIVEFDMENKSNCTLIEGIAMDVYGTGCKTKTFIYGNYKHRGKFVKFIDKWYDFVVENLKDITYINEE